MKLLGFPLLLTGLALILIGLAQQSKLRARDLSLFSLLTGLLSLLITTVAAVQGERSGAAVVLLLGLGVVWYGFDALRGNEDQKALGYYSLLTGLVAVPSSAHAYLVQHDPVWAAAWAGMALLSLASFLVLAVGNTRVRALMVGLTYVVGAQMTALGWFSLHDAWPTKLLAQLN